ncbi:hypothetical protein NPIL_510561, partial [Nephila pilipes]
VLKAKENSSSRSELLENPIDSNRIRAQSGTHTSSVSIDLEYRSLSSDGGWKRTFNFCRMHYVFKTRGFGVLSLNNRAVLFPTTSLQTTLRSVR